MYFDLKIVSFLSLWHSFLFIPSSKYYSPQVIITCKNEEQKRLFAKWHRYLFPNLRFKLTHVKTSDVWLDPDFVSFRCNRFESFPFLAIVQPLRSVSKSLVIHVSRGGYFGEVRSEIAFPVICHYIWPLKSVLLKK